MPTFADLHGPDGKPCGDAFIGLGYFLTQMSALDTRIKIDRLVGKGWQAAIGEFDPALVARAFTAYYQNPDLAKFPISAAWVRTWCLSASPKPARCPDHPSYLAGTKCGGCRAERLELGLEKPIGQTTVPQITQGARAPMPETLRKAIGNVGRAV